MTKQELRALHRRFLLIVPIIIACIIASRAHIRAVGHSFAYPLPEYEGVTITPDQVYVTPPDMMQVTAVEQNEDGIPVIMFEAGTPADGMVLVNTADGGMMFQARVEEGPVIIADGVDFTGWESVMYSLIIVSLASGVLSLLAFAALYRRSWYGYEMSIYAGMALFSIMQGLSFCHIATGNATSFFQLFFAIISMADTFLERSLLPMAISALLVSLSNVALIRREGFRPVNLLGIIASIAWALACLGWKTVDNMTYAAIDFETFTLFSMLSSAIAMLVSFGEALFFGVCVTALLACRHMPSAPRDFLIILGCGLRPDGTPTPLLAGRVDAARSFAERQQKAGMPAPTFVPSGGQGPDEACSEAQSMARYLHEHGVDDEHVLLEDQSTNTRENLRFSSQVIADHTDSERPRVAFATTNYHVLRGYVYAHEVDLWAEGIAAPTRLYFWPNAFLREFVGLIAAKAVSIGVAAAFITAFYVFAEYVMLLG